MKPYRAIIQTRKKTIQFPQSLIPSENVKENEIEKVFSYSKDALEFTDLENTWSLHY
jgi:hypothetical protein